MSAYLTEDPEDRRSFALERGDPVAQHDGAALAAALGLPAGSFEHTAESDHEGQENSRQMIVAVWPATLGYFLREIVGEVCTPSRAAEIRRHALRWLRPGGSLPALRVGREPYGVLTSGALSRFVAHGRKGLQSDLATMLVRGLAFWRTSWPSAPHVNATGDPDADLVGVLGMDASARAYNFRSVLGYEFTRAWGNFLSAGAGDELIGWGTEAAAELSRLGYGHWSPRLVRMALADDPVASIAPIVQAGPPSETEGLAPVALDDGTTGNYISWLRHAPIEAIQDDEHRFPGGKRPDALLYGVLRQSILREYAETAFEIAIDADMVALAATHEQELIGFDELAQPVGAAASGPRPLAHVTAWEALDLQAPSEPAGVNIAKTIEAFNLTALERHPRLGELAGALDRLAGLPTAELERLFTETIDTFSHRIDPWVAALVEERRAERSDSAEAQAHVHLGAYGWVEDVRPSPAPDVIEIDIGRLGREGRPARRLQVRAPREDNGGFVHAPSLSQAATGAVLRSGYLAHRGGDDGDALAIDVSSRRMRVALELVEGVRNGQSLAALLGYRFERGMHDAGGLDVFIQPLRDRFPVVANALTEPHGPVEAVAASGVVDGMALHDAWREGTIDWNAVGASGTDLERILALLADLDDALDALGDLSLSESVFQSIRGNYARGSGLMDALSRGERPPDPEVLHTPRGGTDFVNRVTLVLTGGQTRSAHWPGAGHPRAVFSPRLDAWASNQLPRPDRVRARVDYRTSAGWAELDVALSDLGLGPLDALALAGAAEQPQSSELEQRVVYHALRTLPAMPVVQELSIVFARDPAWAAEILSFPEFTLATRAVRGLLGGSRALLPGDLAPTDEQQAAEANVDVVELSARAAAAIAAIAGLADDLDAATTASELRAALLAASLVGAPGAIPRAATGSDPATQAVLAAQAQLVSKDLRDRHHKAQAADTAFDRTHAVARTLLSHLTGLLEQALGRAEVVLPLFAAPDGAALETAFGNSAQLVTSDPAAPARWFQQLTHVRDGVARWDEAMMMSELLGGAERAEPLLAQLPHEADDRWLALPLDPAKPRPTSGRVALCASVAGDGNLTQPAAGLMIDEWPEQIPSETETTGVAFHYDQPDSRAPQALLLAVSLDDAENWTDDGLLDVIRETLELAKIRTVDGESLAGLGGVLPSVHLPFNPEKATVSFVMHWLAQAILKA